MLGSAQGKQCAKHASVSPSKMMASGDLLLRIDMLSAALLLFYIMFTIFSVLNVITGRGIRCL